MFSCGPCCAPGEELSVTDAGHAPGTPAVTVVKDSAAYDPSFGMKDSPVVKAPENLEPPVSEEKPRGDSEAAAPPASERAATVKHSMKELTKKAIFEGISCYAVNPSTGERAAVRFAIDATVHNFSIKAEGDGGPVAWAEQKNELANLTRTGPVEGTAEGDVTPRALRAQLSQEEFARLCYVESSVGLTLLLCENSTDIPSCLRLLHFHRTQTSPEK